MSILEKLIVENKKKKHRILNQCPVCVSIMELRETKKGRIRLYCVTCDLYKGILGSKTWNRKVKKINGETTANKQKTIPLKTLKTMAYGKYLNTGHWRRRKKAYYAKHKKICYCCGDSSYVLHHINYSRRGEEKDNDLIPLCENCHTKTHEIIGEDGITLENAHRAVRDLIKLDYFN